MKAAKTVFLCSNCGNETPRWQGRCPSCGQWNTLEEYTPPQAAAPSRSSLSNRTSAARGVGVHKRSPSLSAKDTGKGWGAFLTTEPTTHRSGPHGNSMVKEAQR